MRIKRLPRRIELKNKSGSFIFPSTPEIHVNEVTSRFTLRFRHEGLAKFIENNMPFGVCPLRGGKSWKIYGKTINELEQQFYTAIRRYVDSEKVYELKIFLRIVNGFQFWHSNEGEIFPDATHLPYEMGMNHGDHGNFYGPVSSTISTTEPGTFGIGACLLGVERTLPTEQGDSTLVAASYLKTSYNIETFLEQAGGALALADEEINDIIAIARYGRFLPRIFQGGSLDQFNRWVESRDPLSDDVRTCVPYTHTRVQTLRRFLEQGILKSLVGLLNLFAQEDPLQRLLAGSRGLIQEGEAPKE